MFELTSSKTAKIQLLLLSNKKIIPKEVFAVIQESITEYILPPERLKYIFSIHKTHLKI